MAAYEYFLSSLPTLAFGAPPPFSSGELRQAAEGNLSANDLAALDALIDDSPSGHPFVAAWRDRETQLRNAVARARAARAGADAAPWLRPHGGWSAAIESGVSAAFQEADPLARHRALARLRWDAAGDLVGADAFSAAAVLAYAVRLSILEDLATFDAEKGLARLQAI